MPNADIEITDNFLESNDPLVLLIGAVIFSGANTNSAIVDWDVRAALDGLVKTYRTLQSSGLLYESRPENPYALAIYDRVQSKIADVKREMAERGNTLRDAQLLGVLAFWQRIEWSANNGRKRSRAFLDYLRKHLPVRAKDEALAPDSSRIIQP